MSLTIPYRLPDKQPNSTGNRIEDTSFNYTCKQPNQVGFIPYIYLPTYRTGKARAQSIYPKHPYTLFKGNQKPIQRKTSVGYIQQVLHQIESN